MPDIQEIQERLSQIPCPICKTSNFVMNSRGNQGYAEALYIAQCTDCHYTFQVSTPTKPIHQTDPDIAQWLGSLGCPSCQMRGAELNFRCVPSVRDCYYFVTCKTCRYPFYEKSPMEAFE